MNDKINTADANNISLYADDSGRFLRGVNIYNLINHVQNYFRRLKQWFVCNKLTLNADKSNSSVYHTVNKFVPERLEEIATGHTIIKRSRTVKYIGLHIDELLNWKTPITYIKLFHIFNQLNDYVSEKLAKQIYYSLVNSCITYGIEAYGSCAKTLLERFQILQNKLLKLLLRLHPLTSTN